MERNLVFTSAGDRSNLRLWLQGRWNFDLWVCYYGDRSGTYQDVADRYTARKGSKFQNIHHLYMEDPSVFHSYEAVMVMDDDVVISGKAISRLFDLRNERDLWLLQPAFRSRGKISHEITRVNPRTLLRFTNFVEMTCPLFRMDKFEKFMRAYDPELVGWGMDWWFTEVLGDDVAGKIAVVDGVLCTNPFDQFRGGTREIDRLQNSPDRLRGWEQTKVKYGLRGEARGLIEYGRVPRRPGGWALSLIQDIVDRCIAKVLRGRSTG